MKPSRLDLGGEGGQLRDLRVEGEGRVEPAEPVPDGGRDLGVLRPDARVARPDAAGPAFAHGAGDGLVDRVLEAARKRERRVHQRASAACSVTPATWAPGGETTPRISPARTPRATSTTRGSGEAEALEDLLGRCRHAEAVDGDDGALSADPALPAQRGPRLDAHAGVDLGRQDLVPVGRRLGREALPAGQRDDASAHALGGQHLAGSHGQVQLGSGGDEDELGAGDRAIRRRGLGQHIGSCAHAARARSVVPARMGSFWRLSARAVGPARCSTASAQAAEASFASPGRTKVRFGMARSAA